MNGDRHIEVHPTAVIAASAELADGVVVGPLCHVGEGVRLGEGTRLLSGAMVLGPTVLGARNVVHPYAVLGGAPQDKSYRGEPTRLVVGDDNVFREHVTANRGTAKEAGVTTIGSGGLFMAGSHVAHDCVIGDGVILGNGTLLAGHVKVLDHVVTGGGVAVQPFVRLGQIAFLAGGAMVERDVPPFVIAAGDRARVRGLNKVGLARQGVPPASVSLLRSAYLAVFARRGEQRPTLPAATLADPFVRAFLAAIPTWTDRPGGL